MPVLLPSWVESCWEEGLQKVVYATDPEMVTSVYYMSETSITQSLFLLLSFSPTPSSSPLLSLFPPSSAVVAPLSTIFWLHNLGDWSG